MSVDLKMEFDKKGAILKLRNIDKVPAKKMARAMTLSLQHLRSAIDKNLAQGTFGIKTRTGMLRASLAIRIEGKGDIIKGIVGTNLVYARIQEKGGKINVTRKMSGFAWHKWYDTGDVMWKAIALKKGRQITLKPKYYMEDTFKIEEKNLGRIFERQISDGLDEALQ